MSKVCFCGCGGSTKSKFVPGHDARFHGLAKRVVRGEVKAEDALATLAHDEAREAFTAYMGKIKDAEAERAARLTREKAEKLAERARVAAERATEKATALAEMSGSGI